MKWVSNKNCYTVSQIVLLSYISYNAVMVIYHGSVEIVEKPEIRKSERMLDFGVGFYTTSNKEQAIRWAQRVASRSELNRKILSVYEFDKENAEHNLVIIRFDKPDYDWLDFVCLNRLGQEIAKPYDMVIGPVANDQVYTTVALYEQGILSREAAIIDLKISKLYDQLLFHSEKTLNYCSYIQHNKIED